MALASLITTEYTPDQPRLLDASYRIGSRDDRQFLDDQVLGVQKHLSASLIRGQVGSNFQLSSSSAPLTPGDVFCAAPEAALEQPYAHSVRRVTKATTLALAAAGVALGIATSAGAPGGWFRAAMEGIVGRDVTGLAPGAAGYVRVGSNARPERVVSHTSGDYPLGYVDGYGNLSMARGRAVSADGGGGGGYSTVLDEGTPQTQRTSINFVGAGVTVDDFGSVTRVTIPGGAAPSGSATGQTQVWNGSAWTAGALDLADVDAVTGILPAANGGTGIGGAGGTANRVLTTTNGSTWAAGLVALATMVSGLLPAANFADGSATSVFGRAGGTAGVQASIAATADGQAFRRAGGELGFGALDLASGNAVSGLLPLANVTGGSAVGQVLLNGAGNVPTWGALDLADADARTGTLPAGNGGTGIAGAGGTSNRVLLTTNGTSWTASQVALSTMVTGLLPLANFTGGSAVGQVLVNGASNVPAWGALDLADADARTGTLPAGNGGTGIAGAGGTSNRVLLTTNGTSWSAAQVSLSTMVTGLLPLANLTGGSAIGQVLRNTTGNVPAWGALDLADADAVTGLLPHANLADGLAASVFGRAGGTAGPMAPIAAPSDGLFLGRVGGVLTWATVGLGSFAGGTAVGQVLRNTAGNVPAWGAVDLADTDAITGLLPLANLTGGSAVGQVLRNTAGNVAAWGALDLADGDAVTGLLPFANIANGAAASIFGRSPATGGVMASIASTADGQIVRRAGGVIEFGALNLASANAITGLMPLANLTGGSAVGQVLRNTAGNIAAWGALDLSDPDAVTGELLESKVHGGTAVGQVLVNGSGNVPAWGAVNLGDSDAITGVLPFANLTNGAGTSVLVRASGTAGPFAALAASADGVFLQRVAGALVWATVPLGSITGGSAVGQVLRNAAGNVPQWGALDLADADAVTGLLPGTNVSPNFGSQTVQTTGSGLFNGITNSGAYAGTAGGLAVATLGDIRLVNGDGSGRGIQFADSTGTGTVRALSVSSADLLYLGSSAGTHISVELGGDINIVVAGTRRFEVTATALNMEAQTLRWRNSVTSAQLGIDSISTVGGVGTSVSLYGQDSNGTGSTVGGLFQISSGDAPNGVGGTMTISSGTGASSTQAGGFFLLAGASTFLSAPGTVAYPTAGFLRLPNGYAIGSRTAGGTNVDLLYLSGGDGIVIGHASVAAISMVANGGSKLILGTSTAEFGGGISTVRFDSSLTGGVSITHEADNTPAQAAANKLSVLAQSRIGTGATVGAELELGSGAGATAGLLTMKYGAAQVYQAAATGITHDVASSLYHRFRINSTERFVVTDTQLIVGNSSLAIGTTTQSYPTITWASSGTGQANVGLLAAGATPNYNGGSQVLFVGKNVTVPSTTPTNGMYAWVRDNASDGKFGLVTRAEDGVMRLGNGATTELELSGTVSGSQGIALRSGGVYFVHHLTNSKTSGSAIFTTTNGIALGYSSSNSVAQLAYDTVALGTISTGNVSLFAPPGGFSGMQGGIYWAEAQTVPSAAPGSGGFAYTTSAGLQWLSHRHTAGSPWEVAPATTYARKSFTPTCSGTAATGATTICTQSLSDLPSNCSGVARVVVSGAQGGTQIGSSTAWVLFKIIAGVVTVDRTSDPYVNTGLPGGSWADIGLIGASQTGGSITVTIDAPVATARTYRCRLELEYNVV